MNLMKPSFIIIFIGLAMIISNVDGKGRIELHVEWVKIKTPVSYSDAYKIGWYFPENLWAAQKWYTWGYSGEVIWMSNTHYRIDGYFYKKYKPMPLTLRYIRGYQKGLHKYFSIERANQTFYFWGGSVAGVFTTYITCAKHFYFSPYCDKYCEEDEIKVRYCDKEGNPTCFPGYKGEKCTEDVDECSEESYLCNNDGTCVNQYGSFKCVCRRGYYGPDCQHDVNECLRPNLCENGGTCVNTFGSFKCICPPSYAGPKCRVNS